MLLSPRRPLFGLKMQLLLFLLILLIVSAVPCGAEVQPHLPLLSMPADTEVVPATQSGGRNGSAASSVSGGHDYGPRNSGDSRDSLDGMAQDSSRSSRQSPAAVNGDYILDIGDTIELVVYHEPDLGIRAKIGNDGMVQLPMLGEIKLAGLAVRSASSLIRQRYDADYVVNPQIYLDVVSYHPRRFSVGGQVGHPGSYDFAGGDAPGLLDAIGMAGGFLPSADRSNVIVKRREGNSVKTIPLNAKEPSVQNFQLMIGDDIIVGEGKFTIIGQVGRPGTYNFGDSDSLGMLEAIGMAGGFTRIADRGHITVKRKEADGMRTLRVNAKRLTDDKPDHFEIKNGDVINVGESWY